MYKFFGPQPEGEMRMKPRYVPLCCKTCGRYDDDAVFEAGFEVPVIIRIKGDFSHTQDRVLVVSEKFLKVLRKSKVRGYETRPVGTIGWHALRATARVDFDKTVMKAVKPLCRECKRAKGTKGRLKYERQLSVPSDANTIFTTNRGWPTLLWDRDVFLTEDVVNALKVGGIKGGYCKRLLSDGEADVAEEKLKLGPQFEWWMPPGSTVFL